MSGGCLLVVAGGTTESRTVAEGLSERGYRVLLSQATDAPFQVKQHPRLSCRSGRLTAQGWGDLLCETGAAAIVDAAHPHALELRETLRAVTTQLGVPLLRLSRATVDLGDSALIVKGHVEAAQAACEKAARVLVTVGTRHLQHYVHAARETKAALFVRVLDVPESREALQAMGCSPAQVILGRGPFSVEQNLQHLSQCRATALVTKDSGKEGGLASKLEAARQLGCRVIVVARPEEAGEAAQSVEELFEQLAKMGL